MKKEYRMGCYLIGSLLLGIALSFASVDITNISWWVIATIYHVNSWILLSEEKK